MVDGDRLPAKISMKRIAAIILHNRESQQESGPLQERDAPADQAIDSTPSSDIHVSSSSRMPMIERSKKRRLTLDIEVEDGITDSSLSIVTPRNFEFTDPSVERADLTAAHHRDAKREEDIMKLQEVLENFRSFKRKHVRMAQPLLIQVMILDICERDDIDQDTATWVALQEYFATFGPTHDVHIDAVLLREQQNRYPVVLAKLRDAIPPELFPRAEASPQDVYYGHPFYPGRVLLGTNDGSRVWGYLRRVRKNHKTLMELHYNDNRGGEEGHTPFAQSDFLPSCRLLADHTCQIGAHDWKERVKRAVKIVMLEAGYSESVVSRIPSAQLKAIRGNLEKGLDNLPQAAGLGPGILRDQIASPVASPSVLDYDYFALLPGKVLLGYLRDVGETPVWGAFRRPKPVAKVQTLSESWQMCFFDDNLYEVELPGRLDGTINFVPAFRLLTEGEETVGTLRVWFARLSTCVRIALIDAGLQDGEDFSTRQDARPREVAALIKKNWMRLRRTIQGPGHETEQEIHQPVPRRKSGKTRTTGASAMIATVHDQAQMSNGDESSSYREQAQDLMTVMVNTEISEDEDDIMETGYQLTKSDKQLAIFKA
ncbi:hypothetical protein G6011_10248 [Alternaria panax]|uniref:Uncharacterized protein n=1 Tax=Alternaria panax TaxID=48097 RepID=A0AAD4NQB0_9PLEO|nr:hypothetical protein G6011_10248 [Alternaria panax]